MLVLLKTTNGCNLRCHYCSGACGDQPRHDMTVEDCALLARELPSILQPEEHVIFLWHGGEPTLLKPQDFAAMQTTLDSVRESGHQTQCQMQTNGYRMGQEWLEVLTRFAVHVGLSVDGPVHLHDAARLTPEGQGSYSGVIQNLAALRTADIPVSLLCTIGPSHLGQEGVLLDWLEEMELPVKLNPLLCQGRSDKALSLSDYFGFLRNFFAMGLQRQSSLRIEPLDWMLKTLLWDVPPRECSYSGNCGVTIFSFAPGGEVGLCNRASGVFGNLHETSLRCLHAAPQWQAVRQRKERLKAVCGACSIKTYCHGGCLSVCADAPDPEDCAARRTFFHWLAADGLTLLRSALVQRQGVLQDKLHMLREARHAMHRAD